MLHLIDIVRSASVLPGTECLYYYESRFLTYWKLLVTSPLNYN